MFEIMANILEHKGTIGSSFNDFLHKEGLYNEVQANALKKVTANDLKTEMKTDEVRDIK